MYGAGQAWTPAYAGVTAAGLSDSTLQGRHARGSGNPRVFKRALEAPLFGERTQDKSPVIRVLVSANSAVELAGLEAMVKSAPSLELAGSNLGQAGLDQQLADTQPDVLLQSADVGELERVRGPGSEANSPAIVVLAPESEFQAALAELQDSSVAGVLPAWASPREIQAAVEAAAAGLMVVHPDVAEHLRVPLGVEEGPTADAARLEPSAGTPGSSTGLRLSPRETEILTLVAAGLGNKEIAWRLKISEHTVKFHVTSIFNKLGASGRAEAVAIGIRRGLIVL